MSLKAINLLHLCKRENKKYCIPKNSIQYSLQNSLQNSLQYSLQSSLQYSLQCSKIISMVFVSLLCLPLVFVYFSYITFLRLKVKNSSMKSKTNHQNEVICFRKLYNKWLVLTRKRIVKTL